MTDGRMSFPRGDVPADLAGHDPEEQYGEGWFWQYASELANRRGCEPDNPCWDECREAAADDLRELRGV